MRKFDKPIKEYNQISDKSITVADDSDRTTTGIS